MARSIICILMFYSILSNAQQSAFIKVFDNSNADGVYSVAQDVDSNYILAGYTNQLNDDAFLIKVNNKGEIINNKVFDGGNTDGFSAVSLCSDGYILCGNSYSFGAGSRDGELVKLDYQSNIIWQMCYGGLNNEALRYSVETTEKNIISVGNTESFTAGILDVYLQKTDSVGNYLWGKGYGGVDIENAKEVRQTIDGGYIIIGYSKSFDIQSSSDKNIYIVRTDSLGEIEWSKVYNRTVITPSADYGDAILALENGNFIIAGESWNTGSDYLIMELSPLGNIIWAKIYDSNIVSGSLDDPDAIIKVNGGYVFCGDSEQPIGGSEDPMPTLIKIDTLGNVVWAKVFESENYTNGYGVIHTLDGGYAMAATESGTNRRSWLIKTDSLGNIPYCDQVSDLQLTVSNATLTVTNANTIVTPGGIQTACNFTVDTLEMTETIKCKGWTGVEEMGVKEMHINVYPNPAQNNVIVAGMYSGNEHVVLLKNALGQTVVTTTTTETSSTLDVSKLPIGLYFVIIQENDQDIYNQKLVIER